MSTISSLKLRQQVLLDALRQQCLNRGLAGIKGLCVLFRGMDKDYSKNLSHREFTEGMKRYGLMISDSDIKVLFQRFDKDSSGSVDFKEFVEELRPAMPQCRKDVINESFEKIDINKDNVINADDLKVVYRENAEAHPKYISGEWSLDDVLSHFLDTFDTPEDRDGTVTREEFMNYYAGVSCTIEENAYFDLMMRSCWGLPPRRHARK